MSNAQEESIAARRKAVGTWFELASKNARAAVLSAEAEGLQTHALYWTQQSMEAVIKGFGRRVGMSHESIKHEGHNLLHLYANILDKVVKDTGTASYLDKLFSDLSHEGEVSDVLAQLQKLLALSESKPREDAAKNFYSEMLIAPPEVVDALLTILKKQYDLIDTEVNNPTMIENMTGKPFKLSTHDSGKGIRAYAAQEIIGQITTRQKMEPSQVALFKEIVPRIIAGFIDTIGEESFVAEIKANEGRFSLEKERLIRVLDVPKASIGMLIVGSLVWPHESNPRYPASPEGACRSYKKAAPDRQLGYEHYTEDIGVIKYIRNLSIQAEKVTTLLHESYQDGFLFPDWAAAP